MADRGRLYRFECWHLFVIVDLRRDLDSGSSESIETVSLSSELTPGRAKIALYSCKILLLDLESLHSKLKYDVPYLLWSNDVDDDQQ